MPNKTYIPPILYIMDINTGSGKNLYGLCLLGHHENRLSENLLILRFSAGRIKIPVKP